MIASLDKNKVKQSFSSAARTYDDLATLQRRVGHELLTKTIENNAEKIILDVGCGTGFITQEIVLRSPQQKIVALDIALFMLHTTQAKIGGVGDVAYLCADAEYLPLANSSIDKIISNLALQWCQHLARVFEGFRRVLQPQGQVFFSTFGSSTLKELKQSWAGVDHYQHVNDFYSMDELTIFLQQAGFENIQLERKYYRSTYPTVMDLMRELKGIGAHNVLSGRNKKLTSKSQMQKMIDRYEQHRDGGFIPATYEIIFVSASVSE
jgi:malonyl-CoA O-methyltransferase